MTQINLRSRLKSKQPKDSSDNSKNKEPLNKTSQLEEESIPKQDDNKQEKYEYKTESKPEESSSTGKIGTYPVPVYDFDELKEQPKKKKFLADVNKKMLLIAILVATIAGFLAMNYINSTYSDNANLYRPIKVVVAAKEIPARSTITVEMLKIQEIPAIYVVGGALKPTDNIVGKIATTTIFANEQLHRLRVSIPNSLTGIGPIIPAGHRSMKIGTSDSSGIKPTDYVDIIVSLPDPHNQNKVITTPALQKALILAVGNQISIADPESLRNNQLTIAVPENKVNLMVLLKNKGNFTILSRAPGDESVIAENFTPKELENALLGQFVRSTPNVAVPKNNPAPVRAAPVYNAPAYNPPVYHAPVRTYQAPVRQAPPRQAPARAPMVFNLNNNVKK